MSLFRAIEISASALTAQRLRLDTIANNLANAHTTRSEGGVPFQRQLVVLAPRRGPVEADGFDGAGVRVQAIVRDQSPPRLVYDPAHPDADARGYVAYPNVQPVTEMVNLIDASRAYEANVTALQAAKEMALRALDIGRV